MSNSINWNCGKCGRHMTPCGYDPARIKEERARAEADGKIKRAKNIVVGDVIFTRYSKIQTLSVRTVETTSKGKVIINKGMGHCCEDTLFAEQWVDICRY